MSGYFANDPTNLRGNNDDFKHTWSRLIFQPQDIYCNQ